MKFGTAKPGENLRDIVCKEVKQSGLTSDCWLIQMQGLIACETCDLAGTKDCGGQDILKKELRKARQNMASETIEQIKRILGIVKDNGENDNSIVLSTD